jgi:hypothetical protein
VGASLKLYADQLFTLYLLPVEIVGFILLITMIGVIVLSRKEVGGGRREMGGERTEISTLLPPTSDLQPPASR